MVSSPRGKYAPVVAKHTEYAPSAEGGAAGLACARSRRSVWAGGGGGGAGAGAVGIAGQRCWRAAAALEAAALEAAALVACGGGAGG